MNRELSTAVARETKTFVQITLISPLAQVTSMQPRVKQRAMCFCTRAVAKVSQQLSERHGHGACTVVTRVGLISEV